MVDIVGKFVPVNEQGGSYTYTSVMPKVELFGNGTYSVNPFGLLSAALAAPEDAGGRSRDRVP
jgi:hypothetical protein